MHDLVFGNIAQEVAALSGTPVLLIKPDEIISPFQLRHILVPLDTESFTTKLYPPRNACKKPMGQKLNLLCVIPTLGTLSGEAGRPSATCSPLQPPPTSTSLKKIALEHFQDHLNLFKKAKIPAAAEIARGDPAFRLSPRPPKRSAPT